jgi:hypothetical protein
MPRTAGVSFPGALELDTGVAADHYGQAMQVAHELHERASAVTALLRRRRARPAVKINAAAEALPVRYHVAAQET